MYVDFLKYYLFCRFYFSALRNYVVIGNATFFLSSSPLRFIQIYYMYKNQTQNGDIMISMFSFHSEQVEIFIVTF